MNEGTDNRRRKPDDLGWEGWVDEKIRGVREKGLLDNPDGQGKVLAQCRNPFLSEDQQMAYDLLRDIGHRLPWIDDARAIDARIEKASRCVGIGYDLEGCLPPTELNSDEEYRALTASLLGRCYALGDIRKVPGGNFRREFLEVLPGS